MMGRITWQVVALAGVAVVAIGLVAWLAPTYLSETLSAVGGLAVGLPIRATRDRPAEHTHSEPPPSHRGVP